MLVQARDKECPALGQQHQHSNQAEKWIGSLLAHSNVK